MAEASVPAPLVAVSTGATPGRTVIENSVVSKIVGMAARDVPGVHALGGGAARMIGALRDAMNSADLSQGVRVEVGETQVAVDVSLVADYPVPLQKVADDVRASVVAAVSSLVGMEVAEVNVTINDVHLPSDDAERPESQARVR